MTPKQARAWRTRLVRANARLIQRMRAAMRREYAICAAEFEAGAWDIAKHRARVTWLLKRHYIAAFVTFGRIGAAMLDGDEPSTRAEEKPPTPPASVTRARIVAVLTAIVAQAVAEELVGQVVDRLLEDRAVVLAIESALEGEATFAGAVAAVARNPAVASAVTDAVIATGAPPALPPPPPARPPSSPADGGGPRRPTYRERVAAFVEEYARQRGILISEGTRAAITEAIAQANREGIFGESAVAARVAETLTGVRTANWRARRIARTEVGAAQNAALLAIAEDRGRPFTKTWVAVDDPRTRPSHAAANGQKIASDGMFTVGGAQLAHPGDPSAPLKEIVNCRCSMLLETVE